MASTNIRRKFWRRVVTFFGPIWSPGQEPDNNKTAISPLRNNDFLPRSNLYKSPKMASKNKRYFFLEAPKRVVTPPGTDPR